MSEGKIEVRMPLFDRLVDRDPMLRRELRPLRTLDRGGLKESVRRELERLLNTRSSLPADRLAARERSSIDYGVPDFSMFSAASFADRQRLAEIVRRAIVAYEPRLAGVRVYLEAIGDDFRLFGRIEATLLTGRVAEPVHFDTVLQLGDGEAAVR
jgi:type VI secretion system protein ImpF